MMTHTAPCRPYLSLWGVPQMISKSFQILESKKTSFFNTSAHRTGNSSQAPVFASIANPIKNKKRGLAQSHTRKEQLSKGKKNSSFRLLHRCSMVYLQMCTQTNRRRKKKDKQLLNLLAITSLEVLGAVVLGALDQRPRPFHEVVNQHGPGPFFVIVAHVVCYHTTEI